MRTAKEIATDVMLSVDNMRPPHEWFVERVAKLIFAAKIEAVEEFRRRALLACEEEHRFSDARERCWKHIAALPALPEEP